jgi:hypothetical protein
MLVAASSNIFFGLGAGVPVASPGCSKTRAQDGLQTKNNNESCHLQKWTYNTQWKSTWILTEWISSLIIPRLFNDPFFPIVGDVCHGKATAMVTIACVLALGTCPGMALAEPDDRSPMTARFTPSQYHPRQHPQPFALGFEELAEKNQEKWKNSINSATANWAKVLARSQKECSPRCLIFSTTSRSTSPALPGRGLRTLRVMRQRITTRRALAFLGSLCLCALYHLCQSLIIISPFVVLHALRISSGPGWHQVAQMVNVRDWRHALIYIYIIL